MDVSAAKSPNNFSTQIQGMTSKIYLEWPICTEGYLAPTPLRIDIFNSESIDLYLE